MAEAVFELGDSAICDFCGGDFTNSDVVGGMLFESKAACPTCTVDLLPRIQFHGEKKFIRDRAKEGETFHAFVRRLRAGNNVVRVKYNPNNPGDVQFVEYLREYYKR